MRLFPETRERVTKVFRGEADTVPRGYSYLYPHPEKFVKMLDLVASVSPGGLMCMDPDVAETGPEPYAKYAREKKMPLGRLPIEDRPPESFRPPETEPFESFMARYRTM
jgi:hypothetical protein